MERKSAPKPRPVGVASSILRPLVGPLRASVKAMPTGGLRPVLTPAWWLRPTTGKKRQQTRTSWLRAVADLSHNGAGYTSLPAKVVMRILGVQCTNRFAFLAVAEGSAVVMSGPPRLAPAQSIDQDNGLWATLSTFGGALDEIGPDKVGLLLPGTGETTKQPHGFWAPRVELETLLRMAAAKRDIAVDRLSRAAVLSRLGLPRRGRFEDLVGGVVPRVGPYWQDGRLCAAAAALALAQEDS